MNTVKQKDMIALIVAEYPQMMAAPYSEFTGKHDPSEGIWFKQEGACIGGLPVHDCGGYNQGDLYTFNTLSVFERFLNSHGWYSESYDAGTLMAFK